MYDLKPRQKSREKFTTIGFGPSQNRQPNRQLHIEEQPKGSALVRPPALTGLGPFQTDRESHRSRRSGSEKRKAKQTSLMETDGDQQQFAFKPVDTEKFKTMGSYGNVQPYERQHSEKSRRSSKSKKKPKDAMLMDAALDEGKLTAGPPPSIQQSYQPTRRAVQQPNPPQVQLQPLPAAKKEVYDLTAYNPLIEQQPSSNQATDRASERSSSKGSKKKPKDGNLMGGLAEKRPISKPFTFGDVVNKKQVTSIPSSTPQQLDYSEVNSVQFEVSQFNLQRENKFVEESKVTNGQRKRKEANRLGNLFDERNKSRSIENISKISEATSKQRSRIGELFRQRKSQEKSGQQPSIVRAVPAMESSRRPEKVQKPFGDGDANTYQVKEVGADLCNYVQAYQAAKPLQVKVQQHPNHRFQQQQRNQEKELSPEIFKDGAPSKIPYASSPYSPYSPSMDASSIAPALVPGPRDLPKLDLQAPPSFPSNNSLLHDNSPSNFNERNSMLRYSQTPPKDNDNDPAKHHQQIGQESLFFNLENEEKLAASRKKKGLHVISSKESPKLPITSKRDQVKEENQSVRSGSHEKKKVKESTLELLSKASDQKYFDFRVRNSPNKVNDSYYSDDAPPLAPEPMPSQRQSDRAPPAVIKFDDEPPKTYGAEAMMKSLAPNISRTTDNFYPQSGGSSSIYEPSVQSAGSSVKPPYGRPPSCKKSVSSKRSSSKEGSLLDSAEEHEMLIGRKTKKLTLNEVAQLCRGRYPKQDLDNSQYSSDRSQSKKRRKESCIMENCESQSRITGRSEESEGSQRSRSASRQKNLMIDNSKVSEWLPSRVKEQRKAKKVGQTNRHETSQWENSRPNTAYSNKSSLDEFIRPVGPVIKQGPGSYYLQEFISAPAPQYDNDYDDYYDGQPEQRLTFNEMFEQKRAKKRCMPRTEVSRR